MEYNSGKTNAESLDNKETISYNINGKEIEHTYYDPSEKFGIKRKAYIYNEKGDLLEERAFYLDSNQNFINTFTYDQEGKKTKRNSSFPGGAPNLQIDYKYYDGGKKIEEFRTFKDGSIDSKYISIYDDKANLIDMKCYENDSLAYSKAYKYDNGGNLLEETCLYSQKQGGNYYSDDSLSMETYLYSENNNVIEQRHYKDGNLEYKFTYKYDNLNNVTEWSHLYADDLLASRYIYKYEDIDEKGNWLKRITQNKEGIITYITLRNFQYYK
jgi:hypothetical protein